MILYLVRHGQSVGNLGGRVLGQAIWPPLTKLGREQAKAAADELANVGAKTLWTSDQIRASQTADIIAEQIKLTPQPTNLLREQHRGDLEGKTAAQLSPVPVPKGLDITEVRWGGGESVVDVYARLKKFLPQLAASAEPAIIVAHRDLICILLAVLDAKNHRDVEWATIAHGQVLTKHWQPSFAVD